MRSHLHVAVEDIAIYGLSAILVINLLRIGAGLLIHQGGSAATVGKSVAAVL